MGAAFVRSLWLLFGGMTRDIKRNAPAASSPPSPLRLALLQTRDHPQRLLPAIPPPCACRHRVADSDKRQRLFVVSRRTFLGSGERWRHTTHALAYPDAPRESPAAPACGRMHARAASTASQHASNRQMVSVKEKFAPARSERRLAAVSSSEVADRPTTNSINRDWDRRPVSAWE